MTKGTNAVKRFTAIAEAVVIKIDGVVVGIRGGAIFQPEPRFGGGSIKWYEDIRNPLCLEGDTQR